MIIDTHAHLYLEQFDPDRDLVMQRARANSVNKVLLPNICSHTIESMYAMERNYPDMVHPMMGLHPCHVDTNYVEELKKLEKELSKRPFIAVGEIGIDLYWSKSFVAEQKDAFVIQIEWAKSLGIPIVIHSRESTAMILDILESMDLGDLQGVFHCFGGSIEQLRRIQRIGFYIGIGGVVSYKSSKLDKVLKAQDISSIVLETDAPYLSPTPHRGKRNESSYLPLIANRLAEILNISTDVLHKKTTANAVRLFGLKSLE